MDLIPEYQLIKKGTELIAGFVLSEDSANWMDDTSSAYYLRRVVSKVGYKNLGRFISAEAKKLTKAAGKDVLRLECLFGNTKLNDIWESLGFAYIRDAEGQYHCSLREWSSKADLQS